MLLRPIYRWKRFWFGVLSFSFLAWASLHCRGISPSVNFTAFGQGWGLGWIDQHTCLVKYPTVADFGWAVEETSSSYEKRARFWTACGSEHRAISDRSFGIFLFLLWLGAIAWRLRKQKAALLTPL